MVYYRKKNVKGREYWYEQETYRENGSVKTKHVSYVGVNCPLTTSSQVGTTKEFVINKDSEYSFEKYDLNQVKLVGKGSDRIVGTTPKGEIIKIAITPRGLLQNDSEGDWGAPTPKVIEKGKDYVIVENIPRNDKKSREMLKELKECTMDDFKNKTSKLQTAFQNIDEKYDTNTSDIMNYNAMFGDVQRESSWGWKDNTPYLIDAGTLTDIGKLRTNEEVYKANNYTRKEWGDIISKRETASNQGCTVLKKDTRIRK